MEEKNRSDVLLDVRDLTFSFKTYAGEVQAVRGVSFTLEKGKSLGIVGESGCGKSVTAKSIIRLNPDKPKGLYKKGEILFEGQDLLAMSEKEMQKIRAQDIRMIFQDPMTSLNPTMTIGKQIVEGIMKYGNKSRAEAKKIALETLALAGIPSPEDRFKQYPHEFSGGMRQRAMIALAMAVNPKLLIADEPTTALDVTIQAQILDLIKDIQKKMNLSVIYITHDLGVVAKVADYVNVMYAGKIVEVGNVEEIFYEPVHPYTWGLLSAMPDLDTNDDRLYSIPGSPPNLLHEPQGDAFAARNPFALKIDKKAEPPMFQISRTHFAATWLLHPDAPDIDMPRELKERIERSRKEAAKYL